MRASLERRGGTLNDYVFPSRNDYMAHLSTRQYARLVHEWVAGIGLQPQEYGTHSLRRTKASIIYKATGNLRAVQILLGTPRSRARCATLALTSKTPLSRRSAPRSDPDRRPTNPPTIRKDPQLVAEATFASPRSRTFVHGASPFRRGQPYVVDLSALDRCRICNANALPFYAQTFAVPH